MKKESTQTSESNAPIARDYGKDTSIDSIPNESENVNTKLSLGGESSDVTNGYRVYGHDVVLEDLGQPRTKPLFLLSNIL